MESFLQLHEFFVEGKNSSKSHVLLNIIEPTTPVEKEKGYFFVLCEIINGNNAYILKIQEIIDKIGKRYYKHRAESLEEILEEVNQKNNYPQSETVELNCVIGTVRGGDLIFSFCGRPRILFFYRTPQKEYRTMDLTKENEDEEDENEFQLFSQIIQGKITPNDYLFIGTSSIKEELDEERLKKIITDFNPSQSAQYLQKIFSESKNPSSFGGLVMKPQQRLTESESVKKEIPIKKGDSAKSLRNFFDTEANTSSLLSPSIVPNLGKIVSGMKNEDKNYELSRQEKNSKGKIKTTWLEDTVTVFGYIFKGIKYLATFSLWLLLLLYKIFIFILKKIKDLLFIITNIKGKRGEILKNWEETGRKVKNYLKNLSLVVKILLIASVIASIILVFSVINIKKEQQKQAEEKQYNENKTLITEHLDAAESFIIYNNFKDALQELDSANVIFENLNCEIQNRSEDCANFDESIKKLYLKAQNLTIVAPKLLTDWNELPSVYIPDKMVLINKKIMAYSPENPEIFIYDNLTKKSDSFKPGINTEEKGFVSASVPKEEDYALFIYDNQQLVQYKPEDDSWRKIDISYPASDPEINNLFVYNRNLYTLDNQNKQIYKHTPINSGFGKGKEWLKTNSPKFGDGISLAIDGDLFVLETNGQVDMYSSGQNKSFTLKDINPKLQSGVSLWTYLDLNNIYILDGQNKRLLIIDKQGKLLKQLTAPEFVNPTDMIVDEEDHSAYILDSGKLYSIEW